MAIKAYLVFNITQTNIETFSSQILTWQKAFQSENVTLKCVNNLEALDVLKKEEHVDLVLFWDKDIALMYEIMNFGIKIFNNVDAVRLCDDKAYTYAYLIKNKVLTPLTYVVPLTYFKNVINYFSDIKAKIEQLGLRYPLVVKERRSSLGLGVYLVHNDIELKKVLNEHWARELIIQQYIDEEVGVDYRVYLVNHRPKAVVTRVNKKDFRSNVEQGAKMSVVETPDEELLKTAIKASLALHLDFGAVDLVKGHDQRYYVLEVNSNARTATIDSLNKTSLAREVVKYILSNI